MQRQRKQLATIATIKIKLEEPFCFFPLLSLYFRPMFFFSLVFNSLRAADLSAPKSYNYITSQKFRHILSCTTFLFLSWRGHSSSYCKKKGYPVSCVLGKTDMSCFFFSEKLDKHTKMVRSEKCQLEFIVAG